MRRMITKKQIDNLATKEEYENLVKATPTDVNIVQDEGKWQIQLEHDGVVLSITDLTPFVESITGGN